MRTAGQPTFRKLYYRNDNENMGAGTYQIDTYMSTYAFVCALGCGRKPS